MRRVQPRRMFRRSLAPQPTVQPTTSGDADEWRWCQLGRPLPPDPLLARGALNQYVALWYAEGLPVMGVAWADGGRLRCCFAWRGRRLASEEELGGSWVQILTASGDFASRRFEYRWVRWRERNDEDHALVCVWTAAPAMDRCRSGRYCLGHVDLETQLVTLVTPSGTVERRAGRVNAWVLVRSHARPAVFPGRTMREPQADQWRHLLAESPANEATVDGLVVGVEARGWLGLGGPPTKHYVALWHRAGSSFFGRCWLEEGRLRAAFGVDGRAFTGELGTFQVL